MARFLHQYYMPNKRMADSGFRFVRSRFHLVRFHYQGSIKKGFFNGNFSHHYWHVNWSVYPHKPMGLQEIVWLKLPGKQKKSSRIPSSLLYVVIPANTHHWPVELMEFSVVLTRWLVRLWSIGLIGCNRPGSAIYRVEIYGYVNDCASIQDDWVAGAPTTARVLAKDSSLNQVLYIPSCTILRTFCDYCPLWTCELSFEIVH